MNVCPKCKHNTFYLETMELTVKMMIKGVYNKDNKLFDDALNALKTMIPEQFVNGLRKENVKLSTEAASLVVLRNNYELLRIENDRFKKFFRERLKLLKQIREENSDPSIALLKVNYLVKEEYDKIGEALTGTKKNKKEKK